MSDLQLKVISSLYLPTQSRQWRLVTGELSLRVCTQVQLSIADDISLHDEGDDQKSLTSVFVFY